MDFHIFGSFGNEPMQSCSFCCVVVLSVSSSLVWSVYSSPSDSFDHRKLYILQIYVAIPLVYAHEILGQCDMYFLNFSKFLYVALLSTWLNLEPSYLTVMNIYIMHLSIIFLKL